MRESEDSMRKSRGEHERERGGERESMGEHEREQGESMRESRGRA